MAKREELIVGLDIGTTKIAAIVGEPTEDGIDIIGIGTHPSRGLRKGVVVNIDATVSSIQRAVEEAEHMAGCQITQVYAGIAGSHIKGLNSHGIVAVRDKEVRREDKERVIEAAKAVAIPMDRQIIHVLPQEFIVDEQDGIRDPLGMSGVRLEAKVHIVTAALASADNIIKCCNRCGLQVADVVLEPLASAQAVLHEDERELGVALVDIGGGTSDIAVFRDGAIISTSVLPLGGQLLTNDIAQGLRTPLAEAEKIKLRSGCAMTSLVGADETIEIASVGGRPPRAVPRQFLCDIIEPRMEELFGLVQRELNKSGLEEMLASGVVVTGGSTLLEGTVELGQEVLGLPVRAGAPHGVGGLVEVVKSPCYATGVGLVLYGARQEECGGLRVGDELASRSGLLRRLKNWFVEVW
jgi:cell division protein FtsA